MVSDRIAKEQASLLESSDPKSWIDFAYKLRHFSQLAEIEYENLTREMEDNFRRERAVLESLRNKLIRELRETLLEFNVKLADIESQESAPESELAPKMRQLLAEMSEDEDEDEQIKFDWETARRVQRAEESQLESLNHLRGRRANIFGKEEEREHSLETKLSKIEPNLEEPREAVDTFEISEREALTERQLQTTLNLGETIDKK